MYQKVSNKNQYKCDKYNVFWKSRLFSNPVTPIIRLQETWILSYSWSLSFLLFFIRYQTGYQD